MTLESQESEAKGRWFERLERLTFLGTFFVNLCSAGRKKEQEKFD